MNEHNNSEISLYWVKGNESDSKVVKNYDGKMPFLGISIEVGSDCMQAYAHGVNGEVIVMDMGEGIEGLMVSSSSLFDNTDALGLLRHISNNSDLLPKSIEMKSTALPFMKKISSSDESLYNSVILK